jgi:hypothetical protein
MSTNYEHPELVELGPAQELTLGAHGCTADGHDCKMDYDPKPPVY